MFHTLHEFFWSVFSRIWTECGYLQSKSPYVVQIRENTDSKKVRIWTLFTQWQFFPFCLFFDCFGWHFVSSTIRSYNCYFFFTPWRPFEFHKFQVNLISKNTKLPGLITSLLNHQYLNVMPMTRSCIFDAVF